MKVQVTLSFKASSSASSTIDLIVSPFETVASLKKKVADVHLIPCPDQELYFDGKVLANESKLAKHGVREGCLLKLAVQATEKALVQQLSELLQTRDLSLDELGLLYCYKHGASIGQALELLGFQGKLVSFIGEQKTLSMNGDSVTLVREDSKLKPVVIGCDKKRVPLQEFDKKPSELAIGTPPGLGVDAPPGLGPALPPGLDAAPPGLAQPVESEGNDAVDAQQYVDLHNAIYSRTFSSKMKDSLNDLVVAISDMSFLDIDHVVTSGSVHKGTAISDAANAEIVLCVPELPGTRHATWLPSLLQAVASVLALQVDDLGIGSIIAGEESITLCMKSPCQLVVNLFVSPVCAIYKETIQVLGAQGPDASRFYTPAFAKERTQFISRQPSSVKQCIRLLKWWRDQQQWSSQKTCPNDDLLELAAVYSTVQTKPSDLKTAIANVLSLLSRFNQLRVVWSNYYSKESVSPELLRQRPLLMDPVNPYVNVADPQTFDASELMQLAQTTHFFW